MQSKVLKAATLTGTTTQRRLGDSPEPLDRQPQAAPPGRWMTDESLEQLRHEWQAQGRAQAEAEVRLRAQDEAREAAEQALAERLEQLKAQLIRERAEQMKTLALALAQQLQSLRDGLEAQVADWTFVAVSRLLGELTPARIPDIVRRLLDEAGMEGPVTVLVHPEDLALIEPAGLPDAAPLLQWRADAGIGVGGCQLIGPQETLDARLEVQLPLLREALDEARRQARKDAAGIPGINGINGVATS